MQTVDPVMPFVVRVNSHESGAHWRNRLSDTQYVLFTLSRSAWKLKVSSIDSTEEQEVSHNSKIRKHVLISNGEIDNVANFSEAVFPPGEIARSHSHSDMTEVFFIKSGKGVISVNEKSIALKAGMCVTVEPNEMHELINTGSSNMVVMYFGVKT